MNKDKKSYFFQVSTRPDISSYKWVDKEWSILSTIILWGIWVLRFLSLYQHIKAIYRIIINRKGKGKTENLSGRADIPPMMGELYYIAWTLLFILGHILQWDNVIIRGAAIYYLFESSVWILYYTLFRRFFEIGYSIYHQLEYLTAIFLILPTQALCFFRLYSVSEYMEVLVGLLGSGDDLPIPIRLLGCVFSAIVISMIISSFPTETIKKNKRKSMFIVGCGDVVKKRLYPALNNHLRTSDVFVYDLVTAKDREEYCSYLAIPEEICADISKKIDEKSVIWIETPPNTHVSYLKRFIDSCAKLIVLEKPIAITRKELEEVRELIQTGTKRNKIFFLSYYILEKALPLLFLVNNNKNLRKYLYVEDESLISSWRFFMGELIKTEVTIFEDVDNREWIQNNQYGGHMLETFLHNVLVASLLCGQPDRWSDVQVSESQTTDGGCEISLFAKSVNSDINLCLKKKKSQENLIRGAKFTFTGGTIDLDLNAKKLTIDCITIGKCSVISVKNHYDDKYSILVDMVNRVIDGECETFEIDGLINQLQCISWLLEITTDQKVGS